MATQPLKNLVVSVDYLESITGINFVPAFHNSIQNHLKRRIEYLCGPGNIFLG